MVFKVGDKVKVIDDNQKGSVIQIQNKQIVVLTEDGFEEIYFAKELIYDQKFEIDTFELVSEPIPIKKQSQTPSNLPKEIDLHIGQLVDSFRHLSNFEMLQIQLQKVKDEIEKAYKEKQSRLIFIHGHGSGKLKEELLKVLSRYKGIEVYDASFRKYKLGATEVKLRY